MTDRDELRELMSTEEGRELLRGVLHEGGFALFDSDEVRAMHSLVNYIFTHEGDHYESEKRRLDEADNWTDEEIEEHLQDHVCTKAQTAYDALDRENVPDPVEHL